jgi:hypothetical protein
VALVLPTHAFKVKLEETLAKTAMNAEKIRLIQRIDRLPDSLIRPVFDFVEFLLWRQKASSEVTASTEDGTNAEDLAWLNSDLSNLGLPVRSFLNEFSKLLRQNEWSGLQEMH